MNLVLRYLPLTALLVALCAAGLKPDPVPQAYHHQDKLHHLLGFAALGFTAFLTFAGARWYAVLPACLAIGLMIEVGQAFQPARTASVADLAANALGVLLGWALSWPVRRWWGLRGERLSLD